MVKKSFKIEGMTCASCAANIEKSLTKAKGIKKAVVNFASRSAQVEFDNRLTEEKELFEVVKKSGYTPVDMSSKTVKFKVVGMASEHCAGIVKDVLGKLEGIKEVETNFANSSAEIKYEFGKVKVSDMKKAIDGAGYEAVIAEEGEDIYEKEKNFQEETAKDPEGKKAS